MCEFEKKIIAELGSVHDGSFGNAMKLLELAAKKGADIVKFQLHLSKEEMVDSAKSPPYFSSETRKDYFDRIQFSPLQLEKLIKHCKKHNVVFLCSPFSLRAVEILMQLNVSSFKIASGEVNNLYLLEKIAKTKKKIYLSTGMSNYKDIQKAVNIFKNNDLTVMQCTSQYPCSIDKVGLNNLKIFKDKFKCNIGFSDHYLGLEAGFAAAAMGANVIEKHFTFSKEMYGSDAQFAMEPDEFEIYVNGIRNIWKMNEKNVDKDDLSFLRNMKKIFEKSIFLSKDLKINHKITIEDLLFLKPGDGIPASDYKKVLGKKIKKNLKLYHKLKLRDLI